MKNLKNLLLFCLICMLSHNIAHAQKKLDYVEILTSINTMKVFVENRNFKKQVIFETTMTGDKPGLTHQEYQQLKTAYEDLAAAYNDNYLEVIKADISNVNTIKRMIKKPDTYAKRYATFFQDVVSTYYDEFLPLMLSMNNMENQGDVTSLIPIGIDIFIAIIDIFKNRKEGKEAQLQIAVSLANKHLFNSLRMKTWEELDIKQPVETPVPDPITSITDDVVKKENIKEPIPVIPVMHNVMAKGPALKNSVSGAVKFMHRESTGAISSMEFRKGDAALAKIDPNMGDLTVSELPTPGIQSIKAYPSDSYFRFEATGDGLLYIFAINSGNKMYAVYPQIGETNKIAEGTAFDLPYFDPTLSLEIEVGVPPASHTVVQIPDEINYLHVIDKPGKEKPFAETFVILIARKEINLKAVMQKMEVMSAATSVENKLAEIFGETGLEAKDKVKVEGDNVSYSFNSGDPEVIPLTFSILRK